MHVKKILDVEFMKGHIKRNTSFVIANTKNSRFNKTDIGVSVGVIKTDEAISDFARGLNLNHTTDDEGNFVTTQADAVRFASTLGYRLLTVPTLFTYLQQLRTGFGKEDLQIYGPRESGKDIAYDLLSSFYMPVGWRSEWLDGNFFAGIKGWNYFTDQRIENNSVTGDKHRMVKLSRKPVYVSTNPDSLRDIGLPEMPPKLNGDSAMSPGMYFQPPTENGSGMVFRLTEHGPTICCDAKYMSEKNAFRLVAPKGFLLKRS